MKSYPTPNKIIAANFLYGVDPLWEDFLYELLENAAIKDIPVDFTQATQPLPKQLRNSCVVKEYKDGRLEYVSSQIWLAIDKAGKRTIIEPNQTSGVLIEGETGKIVKPFNALPEITPEGTQHLIRILIRQDTNQITLQPQVAMRWTLYSGLFS